jgi:hypothetical protein
MLAPRLAPLVVSLLLPAAAFADPDSMRTSTPPPAPTVMAIAHVDPHAPSETGQLRSARVAAPNPVTIDDGAAPTREHDVAPPHTVAAIATDNDVAAELAAHQMKRHLRALDGCVAAAHKRAPSAAGTLTLDFDVADRKVKSVQVAEDGVHDVQLAACLTSAARGFTFSLASARFRWPVAIRP